MSFSSQALNDILCTEKNTFKPVSLKSAPFRMYLGELPSYPCQKSLLDGAICEDIKD